MSGTLRASRRRQSLRRAHLPGWIGLILLVTAILLLSGYGVQVARSSGALATSSGPAQFPTPIRHFIVVMEENAEWSTVWKYGPYERSLALHYANASEFYGLRGNSLANYLAATSGYGEPTNRPFDILNIADQIEHAGETWLGLMESMPYPCDASSNWTDGYDVQHNPFLWYSDIFDNSTRCATHDVGFNLTNWNAMLATGNLPNYLWVSPNATNDGHNYTASAPCSKGAPTRAAAKVQCADDWLKSLLSPLIQNTALFASTAVFVTYDQGNYGEGFNQSSGGPNAGHVFATLVSPLACGGSADQPCSTSQNYTMPDILTTSQYLLGLPYSLELNDQPANLLQVTTTDSAGYYSFNLGNGSYEVSATVSSGSSWRAWSNVEGHPMGGLNLGPGSPSARSYSVTVRVLGAGSVPIGGAVACYAGNETFGSAWSNAGGFVSFHLTNGSYSITVWAPGYGYQSRSLQVKGVDVRMAPFRLTPGTGAAPPYQLSGAVQANQGPISGATVSVTETGFPVMCLNSPAGSTPVLYEVTGRVVDSSGTPIGGATVSYASKGSSGYVQTDGTGYFSMMLSNGSYTLTASDTGYQSEAKSLAVDGAKVLAGRFMLTSAGAAPPPYDVSGTVSSAAGPVAGATVYANSSGGNSQTATNPLGSYSFSLDNGSYQMTAAALGYLASAQGVIVNGTAVPAVDFLLSPSSGGGGGNGTTYQVTGRVVSENGTAIGGATLSYSGSGLSGHVLTNRAGYFAVELPNGTYSLTASATGYLDVSKTVTVSGSNTLAGRFTLSSG